MSEAAAMLGRDVAECCRGLFAPVGMDLGGDGPEAIALAVLAEVQAVVHGKEVGRLRRLSAADVARYVAEGGVSRYLSQCALDAV